MPGKGGEAAWGRGWARGRAALIAPGLRMRAVCVRLGGQHSGCQVGQWDKPLALQSSRLRDPSRPPGNKNVLLVETGPGKVVTRELGPWTFMPMKRRGRLRVVCGCEMLMRTRNGAFCLWCKKTHLGVDSLVYEQAFRAQSLIRPLLYSPMGFSRPEYWSG